MHDRYLFRGKRLDNGEWAIGYVYPGADGGLRFITIMEFEKQGLWLVPKSVTSHQVDPATIGQCTGLHDRNGKLIFEGDIVTLGRDDGNIYTGDIVWHTAGLTGWLIEFNTFRLLLQAKYQHNIEVIGNIHDNPDLLKEGLQEGLQGGLQPAT